MRGWEKFQLQRRTSVCHRKKKYKYDKFWCLFKNAKVPWIVPETFFCLCESWNKVEILQKASIANVNSLTNCLNQYYIHGVNKRKCFDLKQGILAHCQRQPWTSYAKTTKRGYFFCCFDVYLNFFWTGRGKKIRVIRFKPVDLNMPVDGDVTTQFWSNDDCDMIYCQIFHIKFRRTTITATKLCRQNKTATK